MITQAEKQRLRGMITETITLLCKSGLSDKFQEEFFIEGLIGITLDHQELMMVSIREKVQTGNMEEDKSESSDEGVISIEDKSNRKRKKIPLEGPKEKTSKYDAVHSSPKKSLPSSPLQQKAPVNPFNTVVPVNSTLGLDAFKQSPSSLNNGPVSHLDRLKNLYLMSAGFPNAMNFQRAVALSASQMEANTLQATQPQADKNGAINLSVDKEPSVDLTKKEQDMHGSKDIGSVRVKEEENVQPPSPLLVQPIPTLQPYTSLYSSPLRQQPVFSEPIMVPPLQSPGVTPKRDMKMVEVMDRIKNNLEASPDANRSRSVSDHIAQNIVRSEGSFVTSRIIGRKTGRKAAAVKEVFLQLTTPTTDANHVGQAKEISRGTLVYYKCPPHLIKPEALTKYGLDLDLYKFLYNSEMKTPPSQHMLAIVEERSPYNPNAKGDYSPFFFEGPVSTFGRAKTNPINLYASAYSLSNLNNASESENSEVKKDKNTNHETEEEKHDEINDDDENNHSKNGKNSSEAGVDFRSTYLHNEASDSNVYAGGIYAPKEQSDSRSLSGGSDILHADDEDNNSKDSDDIGVSNKENKQQSVISEDHNKDINLNTDNGNKNEGGGGVVESASNNMIDVNSEPLQIGPSGIACPLKGLEKLVSLQSADV